MGIHPVIGVDVGGSGVKAALVDVERGELVSDRPRLETPQPATPDRVAHTVAQLVDGLGGSSVIGVTVPGVVSTGVVRTAVNIDSTWIGTDACGLFSKQLGVPCTVINDADAAGLAEMRFGAGRGRDGVAIMVTLGTGIGSAVFV
ncbi:MAG: ROK family protein, partial [Candidatus Microthrix parvicella]